MKTSQSFFPTRTHLKSREIRRENAYQLIKKTEEQREGSYEEDEFTINIFRDARQLPPRTDSQLTIERPIGGMDLFRKMEQAGKDRLNDIRRHSKRSNKQSTQRNISSNFNNRFKKDKPDEDRENQDALCHKPISEMANPQGFRSSLPEETLKSHMSYMPHSNSVKSHSRQLGAKATGKSQSNFRPATSKPITTKAALAHDEWAAGQRKQYQDKAALLNQISYNRPLVQVYGQRYFQYILRNRFQQDIKPPCYIYQIGAKKFGESRVIDKIKKYRPEIKQKQTMVVRGKRLAYQQG